MNKFLKWYKINCQIAVFPTLYYWIKIRRPRNSRFLIFPQSIIKISRRASLSLFNGEFKINASWTDGRKRRNRSGLILCDGASLVVEDDFGLYQGASIYIGENAKVRLKGHSYMNTNSILNCFKYIEIGYNTYISDNVSIQDSDNHTISYEGVDKPNTLPIVIGDYVWVGKNVCILKGVNIGNGSVIAAGSIVTKDIPEKCLVAGNPAKVIRRNVNWR